MKRVWILFLMGAAFMLVAETAAAENFRHYSNEQLSSMRHSMEDAHPERRLAYRQEVRRRFGVWIEFDASSDPHDDFWNDMDGHHDGAYGSGHHGGSYREYHYYRNSRINRGGGGC